MICLTKSECCFCLILSRQKCTKYTSQQGFDVPDSPTGHGEEKGFSQTTNTDGDKSPDVSDTRSHCRQSTRNQTTRARTAFRVRGSDKIYCTAQMCADNKKTRLVGGINKDIALLRVRGDDQHTTMRDVTLDGEI